MKIANCPSCGAYVEFKSAASLMAVCPYCRATVLREGQVAEESGRLSEVIDDSSPIQLGTRGRWQGQGFTVMGRLRLQYEEGAWNEWSVEFDDGKQGWLGEASGQYTMTRLAQGVTDPPPYEQIEAGSTIEIGGAPYSVTDARLCRCVGGEGELGIVASDNKEFPSVDLRGSGGNNFATLDYVTSPPTLYLGEALRREELSFSHLRSAQQIAAARAKLKGGVKNFACPSCGASLAYHPQFGVTIACGTCRAIVELEGDRKKIILKQKELEAHAPLLPLGSSGTLAGKRYEVVGFMVRKDGEGERWEEYLLLEEGSDGLLWLIHTARGWFMGEVLNTLPVQAGEDVNYKEQKFALDSQYTAFTEYVLGEFNWRVRVGEFVIITEWRADSLSLSRERYRREVTWTLATPLDSATLSQAFDLDLPNEGASALFVAGAETIPLSWVVIAWVMAFVVDIAAHLAGHGNFVAFLVGAYMLWAPRNHFQEQSEEE